MGGARSAAASQKCFTLITITEQASYAHSCAVRAIEELGFFKRTLSFFAQLLTT